MRGTNQPDESASTKPPWKMPPRLEGERMWFTGSGAIEWEPGFAPELAKRFPALTWKLERQGLTMSEKLHQLSVWHETAQNSLRKKLSAQRWVLRLFTKENARALHAQAYRDQRTKAKR